MEELHTNIKKKKKPAISYVLFKTNVKYVCVLFFSFSFFLKYKSSEFLR